MEWMTMVVGALCFVVGVLAGRRVGGEVSSNQILSDALLEATKGRKDGQAVYLNVEIGCVERGEVEECEDDESEKWKEHFREN